MVNEEKEILKYLIEHQEEKFSIRKISLIRDINYKTAYQNILKLEQRKVISVNKLGNTSLCCFNNTFDDLVFLVEYGRRKSLFKNKNFKVIYDQLETIQESFILLLFGSYSKNMQTKNSDIDFLLIVDEGKKIKAKLDLIPLNIDLTIVNYDEFKKMLDSKTFTVVSEAIKHNIIIRGIEEYYRLIQNDN